MAALKYSKQRASIKEYLLHTTAHPTADTVYLHIKRRISEYQPRNRLPQPESACRHR